MMLTEAINQGYWYAIKDGDPRGLALYRRHYSRYVYKDGRMPRLFVGPGEKMVLMTPDCRALFVWRKFVDDSGQTGVSCSVFRNEGAFNGEVQSSELILAAEQLAWRRWPGERLYTFVNAQKVKGNNPGYCFKVAGWRRCGETKSNKLVILEKLPAELAKAS